MSKSAITSILSCLFKCDPHRSTTYCILPIYNYATISGSYFGWGDRVVRYGDILTLLDLNTTEMCCCHNNWRLYNDDNPDYLNVEEIGKSSQYVPIAFQERYESVMQITCTAYPKKYEDGFVVLCFVVVMQSFLMNSHEVFIHIHQGCFAGTGAIVRLPQCQWSKPGGYGKISQCITTTKHSKAKTVCIFLGIYCTFQRFNHICVAPNDFSPTQLNISIIAIRHEILTF